MENIIIFAPHPDDDIINNSLMMKNELKKGNNITIVYTTQGAKNSEKRYIKARRVAIKKTIKKYFKIPLKNLIFLKYEDTTLYKIEEAKKLFKDINEILKKIKPNKIFIPTYEGGHIDHDVTNFIVMKAIEKLKLKSEIFEYPTYNNYMNLKRFYLFFMREFLKNLKLDNTKYQLPKEFIPYNNKKPKLINIKSSKKDLELKSEVILNYHRLSEIFMKRDVKLNKTERGTDLYIKKREYNYNKPPHSSFPVPLGIVLANKVKFKEFKNMVKYMEKEIENERDDKKI
ncbi:PIG-L deacetylase family protein [Haliovirga abyssi]|uniref:PIG-L family deacetylase n=1 Tax=Haliovirga abyssi TaxID=2996794 RepID=A0AAU9DFW5_9FUSO|nr:PIG-L family deacetylase [Haliovirga abyssi]BDU51113.1 hypothetical protein HLVA_16820 [Haliovirga abyssi]